MTNFFWNFRDLSKFHNKAKKNIVFRSSSLSFYDGNPLFYEMISKRNISTIIDLRSDREVLESSYSEKTIQDIHYVRCPFDPWNQSIEFKNTYNTGTNAEIAYHFFMIECKKSIKKVMETILNTSQGIVIHCHAGKDRTGIIFALLGIFIGSEQENILLDYMASEMDSNPQYLQIVFKIVEKEGGIISYLQNCQLNYDQIQQIKNKLCKK